MRSLKILTIMILSLGWLAVAMAGAAESTESVCLQCHGGMEGHLGAPVGEWRESVHARNGISCHGCHGGDPTDFAMAMSPERGFIGVPEYEEVPQFCGRCHVGVLEDYLDSAHGQAVAEGGAQCVICHNNHDVQEAQLELINEDSCTRCHDYGRAAEIKTALAETDRRLGEMDEELVRLYRLGFDVEAKQGKLFNLRNRFHRVFHTVEVDRVQAKTAEVKAGIDEIGEIVSEIDARLAQRKLWGGASIGLFVFIGIVFLLIRKTYEEEESD